MPQKESIRRQSFRLAPPEGGWGFLIMLGLAISFVLTLGALSSFVLLFGDLIQQIGPEQSGNIAWVTSTYFMSFSVIGLFTNQLFQRFGCRTVGLGGAVCFCIGGLLSVPGQSIGQLVVSYGLLQGAGFAVMMSVSFSTFNAYFVRRRSLMMGLSQTALGIGSILLPLLIDHLIGHFGHTGCRLIVAALNGNALFAMIVMHPVHWHMTLEKVDAFEDEEPDDSDENERQLRSQRSASLVSLGGHMCNEGSMGLPRSVTTSSSTATAMWTTVVRFLDLTLLLDSVYLNICIGMSFALYSDITFFTIQPMYLQQVLGYTQSSIAQIIAIGAAADLISRFSLGIFGGLVAGVRARSVYLAGVALSIVVRIAFLFVNGLQQMCLVTAAAGFFRAWLHVPIALVMGEHLSPERFASGNGLFMFVQGVIVFTVGPCVGWLQNFTGNYDVAFHCLIAALTICAVPWLIERCWRK